MIQTIGRFIFLILVIFAADQLSKFYVINVYNIDVSNLSSQYLTSINKYLNFHLIWNKGFAFGIFQNEISMVNYIYMFVMAIIAIAVFFYAISINKKIYYYGFSLIIGGAVGNLLDRYQYSAVLDFIDLHYNNYHWYVFNIADISITLGCILIILLELFSKKENDKNVKNDT